MSVLRCFDARRQELGTTEIAQLTGLPQPTVWRLCYTLQQLGYLVPSRHGDKLRVGIAVLGLGYFALASTDFMELAHPGMDQIAQDSRAAVSLGIIDQSEILIVKRTTGAGPLLVDMQVGSRFPIISTAAGWAYLAALDSDAQKSAIAALPASPDRPAGFAAAIRQATSDLRKSGFVINEGVFHPDVNAVGSAVYDHQGQPKYILNCGGPAKTLTRHRLREEIGPALANLAEQLSAILDRQTL